MSEDEKISARQFMIFVMMFTIGGAILRTPSLLATEAKQDAWIAAILGLCLSLLLIWLYNSLGSRFPNMTLVEYSEEVLGIWGGKIVSVLFLSYFFLHAAILLREIGNFMTTQVMPETPMTAFLVIFLLIVIAGTRIGIEPLARAAEIFLPWVFMLLFTTAVLVVPKIKVENIQPIFEQGLKSLPAATYPFVGLAFLELFILLMVFPSVNRREKAKRAYYLGTFIGGLILVIIILLSILVIGPVQAEKQIYPSFILAKKINVGDFFQRLEVIIAGSWFITIFFKLTICFYATALGISQILHLRDYRFVTFPLGLILLPLSKIVSKNMVYHKWVGAYIWPTYSLIFGLLLPLLLLAVAIIRKKKAYVGG